MSGSINGITIIVIKCIDMLAAVRNERHGADGVVLVVVGSEDPILGQCNNAADHPMTLNGTSPIPGSGQAAVNNNVHTWQPALSTEKGKCI